MRRARLTVKRTNAVDARVGLGYVSLAADNGERLMTSEIYDTTANARRARAAVLRAMVDVLEDEQPKIPTMYTNNQLREALVASADEAQGMAKKIDALRQYLADEFYDNAGAEGSAEGFRDAHIKGAELGLWPREEL